MKKRLWRYNDLCIPFCRIVTLCDDEILSLYWEYWSEKMRGQHKPEEDITREICIQDWVTINWAWEISGDAR